MQQYLNNSETNNQSNNQSNNFNPNAETDIDDEEKYITELSELENMGFLNKTLNINALKYVNGNLQDAVNLILSQI